MGSARPVDVRSPIVELSLKVDLLRLAGLSGKGAAFKALDDADADTTTRSAKLLLRLLALIAEFEAEIRKERQIEGIAKARLRDEVWAQAPGDAREGRRGQGYATDHDRVRDHQGDRAKETASEVGQAVGLGILGWTRSLLCRQGRR